MSLIDNNNNIISVRKDWILFPFIIPEFMD